MGETETTTIKTTKAVRDRLRVLAAERGATMTDLLEQLASRELTESEREERARAAAEELGIDYTHEVKAAGVSAWAKVRAHGARQRDRGAAA
ncbi:hypothetical protein ACIRU8_15985 [Streptomyces sp. NPDC101175]|uniref:ribbon-helix-helix protein n=1 Tax=Streptomyces sp. NPDC101175 TaxID=3366123 RepID=UPI0038339293